MAEKFPYSSRISLTLHEGEDGEGNPIERRTSFAVKLDAENQDIYDVSHALMSLSDSFLKEISLFENSHIIEA